MRKTETPVKIVLLSLLTLFSMMGIFREAYSDELINGAGATFPYPLYSKWFKEYHDKNPKVRINYQSVGSGAGIKQFTAKTVDFGASDAPMNEEEIQKVGGQVLHIPTVLGAVVVSYNVPEATKPIQMSSDIVADIFLGKITDWNDPRIQKINPDLKLMKKLPILVAYRSDGSGTTSVFTDYLANVSSEWKEKVGQGKAVKWPTGLGGKGNEGVSGLIKQTPGAIGYIELVYAITNKLSHAHLKNASGKFVEASLESVSAAADGVKMPKDYRVSITNAKGAKSYPIAAFTYLLVRPEMKSQTGKALKTFLSWALGKEGQQMAKDLYYAPLPKKVTQSVNKTVASIKVE